MMNNMNKILAQVQKLQEELKNKTVEVSAGGGAIRLVANGKQEVTAVYFNERAVRSMDLAELQDLVIVGVNEVLRKSKEMAAAEVNKLTAGLNLPDLSEFL